MKIIQLHSNEADLIKNAMKNHREAQHRLFEMYAPKMLSVCRYYIKDVQHAESVMLKGFFKVFSKISSFKSEGNFEGWIRRIMVRESISFLRTQKKIEFSIDDVVIRNEQTNNINIEMDVAQIQQLIDGLPDGYRIVFVMYAIEGYKHKEISKELNISESTSKSQLFKARKLLQQRVIELNKTSYGTI